MLKMRSVVFPAPIVFEGDTDMQMKKQEEDASPSKAEGPWEEGPATWTSSLLDGVMDACH